MKILLIFLLWMPWLVQAQPKTQIKIVVPWSAGGSVDGVARLWAAHLEKRLPVRAVVENRVGANGIIAATHFIHNRTEPHTVMVEQVNGYLNHYLQADLSYNPFLDLAPLASMAEQYSVLVAHESLAINHWSQMVKLARHTPGALSFGHGGIGNDGWVIMKIVSRKHGLSFNEIGFKSGNDAVISAAGGHTSLALANLTVAQSNLQQVRIIGKFSPRAPVDVPLVDIEHSTVILLFANKDMAKTDFIKEITKHTRQITESHDFQQQILSRGNRAITYNDNEIHQTILKSVEIWRQAGLVKP